MERRAEAIRLDEPLVPARVTRHARDRGAATHRRRRFLLGAGLVALVLLALAACDGDNLFAGDSSALEPRASVIAPSLVMTGDEFQVQVFADAPRGISRIDVSILDAFFKDTTFITAGSAPIATQAFRFRAPTSFLMTTMIVQARVVDRYGRSSPIAADTATALPRQ